MGWGWGGGGRRATAVWISAAAGRVQSAAARASLRLGAGLGGWGVSPRGSACACAFGGWRTPVLLVRLERRASGEAAEESACFAARSWADGRVLREGCYNAAPNAAAGAEARIHRYPFLLPPAPLPLARSTHFQNVDGLE